MKKQKQLYDAACRDLAIIFLRDISISNPDDQIALAQQFQETAENFIADLQAWKAPRGPE